VSKRCKVIREETSGIAFARAFGLSIVSHSRSE